ncbi:MAG: YihY/virulence factor BrkB family protein [Bacteroidota bacterium]|nr:YihY/virulence factor BrkB family protein [Bacteroidota bacterium]
MSKKKTPYKKSTKKIDINSVKSFDFKDFFKYYFGNLFLRFDTDHIFLSAGGLAFSLFICMIPLVLIIFSVLGNILDSSNMQAQINNMIDSVIPYSQYSSYVKKILFSRIDEVVEYKTAAGIIGISGMLFAASSLFSAMRTVLNKVYGIFVDVNFFLAKLWDFALVFLVILLFFMITISMPIFEMLRKSALDIKYLKFLQGPFFEHFLFSVISLVTIFFLFVVLYITVPRKKLGKKAVFLSAFWSAILWEAAKQAFGYYIYNFANFGKIYGTYALVVVIAFWIYYSAIVFIIGAEIGWLYYLRHLKPAKEIKKA